MKGVLMSKPVVGILMGSDTDLPIMQEAAAMLQEFGVEYEMTVASAHRTPKKVIEYSVGAERRGIKVIIAGAGWAAHLAGVIASHTTLPVIGVPIDSSPLKGLDALLATAQMPGGGQRSQAACSSWRFETALIMTAPGRPERTAR